MAIIKETLKEGEEVSGALTGGLWNTDESNHDTARIAVITLRILLKNQMRITEVKIKIVVNINN